MQNNGPTLIEQAIAELSRSFTPLTELDSPYEALQFLRELGIELPELKNGVEKLGDLSAFLSSEGEFVREVNGILSDMNVLLKTEDALERLSSAYSLAGRINRMIGMFDALSTKIDAAIGAVKATLGSDIVSEESLGALPNSLLDYLLVRFLRERHTKVYSILGLIGLIEINDKYPRYRTHLERLPKLLFNPQDHFHEAYSWGDAKEEFQGGRVLGWLKTLIQSYDLPGDIYPQNSEVAAFLSKKEKNPLELRIPVFMEGVWPSSYVETGLNISTAPSVGGLALMPYMTGRLSGRSESDSTWLFEHKLSLSLNDTMALLLRPPCEVTLLSSIGAEDSLDFRAECLLHRRNEADGLITLCSLNSGTYISFKGLSFDGLLACKEDNVEIVGKCEIEQLNVAIGADDKADGFIAKLLSSCALNAVFSLGVGISNKDSFYFRGSSALEVTIPAKYDLGPIKLQSVTIGLGFEEGIEVLLAASFSAELGPISASVKRMGLTIPIRFPEARNGNLGPVDVKAPSFLPPSGAGLVVNAGGITGGGYLEFDKENQSYAGILELNFGEIGLTAIGLITTRMPDGSKGFSLLINICVTFSPPITLPYNFTLCGVGGLVGINRVMLTDVLRDGLRNQTLDSILFPENAVANVDRIISNLRSVFPPAEKRYVVGPMIKIGWGQNKIITADIGIFLELPQPIRIALLGQISAYLPNPDNAVIELHIDVLGIIEFDKKQLSIDATIYKSRIHKYALCGDAAFRLNWGDNPQFALSLGGFHPSFTPPPNFPSLRRLTLDLSQSNTLQLFCKAYHALTANSLQFGAQLELYAKKEGASIEGGLFFDALIYFNPFEFSVDISGNVVAKYKGHKLAGVNVSISLSGPTPWLAKGRAKFEILCWDVTVKFNKEWGEAEKISSPAIDPWPLLRDALQDTTSWGSRLPPDTVMAESILPTKTATIKEDAAAKVPVPIIVHPCGTLEIRQSVLPLDITLDKLGSSPVKSHNSFNIISVLINGTDIDTTDLEEHFARGQFINLSADQRLSSPSFELLKAGVNVSCDNLDYLENKIKSSIFEYESILIQEDRTSKDAYHKGKAKLPWHVAKTVMKGSSAKCSIRSNGKKKYEIRGPRKGVMKIQQGCQIVSAKDMKPVEGIKNNGRLGFTKAEQEMHQHLDNKPLSEDRFMIISSFESEEAA